ncbi:hypothetical protein F0562_012238 [Nyssa sinensis]|uniref:Uncharacterized protein n=1 Tax=Nyssa sinensis TaxID=561372 RepID=A0A5J4ZS70_9ASTE|nr:hypothetical protein F0562_012238 [Nyssa sinensis]
MGLSIVVGGDRNGQWWLAQLAVLVALNGGVYGTSGRDASNSGRVVTIVLGSCWCIEDNFLQWWHWELDSSDSCLIVSKGGIGNYRIIFWDLTSDILWRK